MTKMADKWSESNLTNQESVSAVNHHVSVSVFISNNRFKPNGSETLEQTFI